MSARADGYTLALEASTYAGSVALLRGAEVACARSVEMRGREEERLMPAVAECVAELPAGIGGLARVVCGAGPGSFTSLRIAASIAKGICHARGLPLYAVSSLALVVAASPAADKGGRYVISLEAMRDEAFMATFDIGEDGSIPASAPVTIVGRVAVPEAARAAGAVLLDGSPHAAGVARMLDSIIRAGAVDAGAWEPDYGRAAEAQVKWEAMHGRPLPR
ncbi:tRNA (adenosine(37)-N6)-threonylcarbamoyltransferase complex dimerization subunit type 1 TsaB [soil metagenome]